MSLTKNDETQNSYLRAILEEIRLLRGEVKKLESDLKDLKKQAVAHNHHHHSPVV